MRTVAQHAPHPTSRKPTPASLGMRSSSCQYRQQHGPTSGMRHTARTTHGAHGCFLHLSALPVWGKRSVEQACHRRGHAPDMHILHAMCGPVTIAGKPAATCAPRTPSGAMPVRLRMRHIQLAGCE